MVNMMTIPQMIRLYHLVVTTFRHVLTNQTYKKYVRGYIEYMKEHEEILDEILEPLEEHKIISNPLFLTQQETEHNFS